MKRILSSIAALSWLAAAAMADTPQGPPFTQAQANAGRQAYRQHCADCHGARLEGMHLSPSLIGERFDQMWRGKSADVLAFHIRRMPPEAAAKPQMPTEKDFTDILAYILLSNKFEPGETALPAEMAALTKIKIPRPQGAEFDPYAPVEPSPDQVELVKNLPPVTHEMLKNPSPDDWLRFGRTFDGQNFSPLDKINKETVANLAPAWRAPLREGQSMATPIVHAGVMYVHTFPDTVLALDATNGKVLWRYQYEAGRSSSKMGVGLYGDKVFVPTSNLHLIALNAKTGELIWDHEIKTEARTGGLGGYQLRTAPVVIGDKVLQGITASFMPMGGFLLAVDIETGKEAWRFNSIARPGTPGGESWNDVPLEKRSGGSVWHQPAYDPELDLIYYGIAPTYDTGPLLKSVNKPGITSDALYTNCTVALKPDTGELVWHYQHMANDQWDLDWVFERQIVDMEFGGQKRKVVMNVGKMAILEAVDAKTGEYLFSVDPGTQNVITAIDPKTGAKTINPSKLPDPSRETVVCPSAVGARSWPPTSFSPQANYLYIPITEFCMLMGPKGMRLLTSGVGISDAEHPDAADGTMARLQAIDVANQKLAWAHNQVAPFTTGVLATGGGLVFAGDMEPSLKVFDDISGQLLWQSKLDDTPSSGIITYRVGEVQYVAVVVGISNLHVGGLQGAYAKAVAEHAEHLKNSSPNGGAAIWVFAL